jgi:hypothetical protein
VEDVVEIVYSNSSADVATSDAAMPEGHDGISCLSDRDLSNFEFISVTRQGAFILVSLKPIDNQLNIIM